MLAVDLEDESDEQEVDSTDYHHHLNMSDYERKIEKNKAENREMLQSIMSDYEV